jgi:hypothetical protein
VKKIIGILILFIALKSSGQFPYPPCSYNAKPELDKFVGTWRWVSGADTLELKLYKQAIHFPEPMDFDVENIIGWHRYVKNGVLIESSFPYAGLPYIGGHSTVFAWGQSPIKLYGNFNDLTKKKRCDIYLLMTNSSYTEISWKIMETRGMTLPGFQYGFTLPVSLTLTKQ